MSEVYDEMVNTDFGDVKLRKYINIQPKNQRIRRTGFIQFTAGNLFDIHVERALLENFATKHLPFS